MKKALLAAVMVAISLPAAVLAKQGRDQPAWCHDKPLPDAFEGMAFTGDGDTIYGVNFKPGIRLWGMNAPELRDAAKAETVPGMRARSLVDDLLAEAKHQVRCEPIEWDGYCRVVATCTTAKGVDLTMATLQAGLAYGFYLSKHPALMERALAYSDAEVASRKARIGLWPQWQGEKVP
jgi:endonuclease YncB( thermonuclease family)